jgi:Flp pilus assembly protein TadG
MQFGRSEKGQAIVEFAMLLPVLVLLLIGIMEFSLVWNSRNTVLFASRDGSMLAAEGGSLNGTDCVVLQRVEGDVVSPSAAVRIQQISIYWSDRNGDQIGSNQNVYTRGGSTSCTYPDGTVITVPYTLATAGYLAPFGYFWTTFLILSLPLASDTLRRASTTRSTAERAVVIGAVVASWLLMEPQEVGTLMPILWHFLGVMLLCVTAVLTLARPAPSPAGLRLPSTRAHTSP